MVDRIPLLPSPGAATFRVDAAGILLKLQARGGPTEVVFDVSKMLLRVAELIRDEIRRLVASGRDLDGQPLKPIAEATVRRRELKGNADTRTPLHATGELAARIGVEVRSGRIEIHWPSDDGRLLAVERYAGQRLDGVPAGLQTAIDAAMDRWGEEALATTAGGGVFGQLAAQSGFLRG